MFPQKPLISDFTDHNALRNEFTLFESTGKAFHDAGTDISRADYLAGATLF